MGGLVGGLMGWLGVDGLVGWLVEEFKVRAWLGKKEGASKGSCLICEARKRRKWWWSWWRCIATAAGTQLRNESSSSSTFEINGLDFMPPIFFCLSGVFVWRPSDQEFFLGWSIRAGCSFPFVAYKMEENIFSFTQRALKSSHGEYSLTSSWSLVCNLFANKPMQDPDVKKLKMVKSAETLFLHLTCLFHFPASCRT